MDESWVQTLGVNLFIGCMVMGLLCGMAMAYFQSRASGRAQAGDPTQQPSLMCVLFRPQQLTDDGRKARRWCLRSLLAAALFMLAGLASGAAAAVAMINANIVHGDHGETEVPIHKARFQIDENGRMTPPHADAPHGQNLMQFTQADYLDAENAYQILPTDLKLAVGAPNLRLEIVDPRYTNWKFTGTLTIEYGKAPPYKTLKQVSQSVIVHDRPGGNKQN